MPTSWPENTVERLTLSRPKQMRPQRVTRTVRLRYGYSGPGGGWTGLDALQIDAQAQPPDGELGEAEECIAGGKRHAIPEGGWRLV
jgi:hypothetical protein